MIQKSTHWLLGCRQCCFLTEQWLHQVVLMIKILGPVHLCCMPLIPQQKSFKIYIYIYEIQKIVFLQRGALRT